jgi:CRISPR-associated endonuclease/helicase Cas3
MTPPQRPAAHTPREGTHAWHDLAEHTLGVAKLARTFADAFGAGGAAYWLGLCHDLGKTNPRFQHYLQTGANKKDSVPHAIWGASLLYKLLKQQGNWQLALPVLGHHAGLHDAGAAASALQQFVNEHPAALTTMTTFLSTLERERLPLAWPTSADQHFVELWLRMLFSALVDADFLDTEEHFDPDKGAARGRWPSIPELHERFSQKREAYLEGTHKESSEAVTRVRSEVYLACLEQGANVHPYNVFRLTVPTAGGKTLSGLAFALEHARAHFGFMLLGVDLAI